ncbi:MAG: hypothetical protein CSA49_04850 [Gammaproteobacteria bacterium]|nr:MAG: hypothetical protein CSA49_04850 [Gammaproteobacteria bacterium]
MKKKIILLILSYFLCGAAFSQTLVLSDKLQLNYGDPKLISHSENFLIVKYKDWSFMHEIVNPKNIYPKIDLTGMEQTYLRTVFGIEDVNTLPQWLIVLAKEQAQLFGIKKNNIKRKNIGESVLVAVYNSELSSAHVYIFEALKIHHIVVRGNESRLSNVLDNIGER